MKKSSLGRRSSLLGQRRLSNVEKSGSRMNQVESKKSFIPKPSFAPRNDRSSSVDREGFGGSSVKKDSHPPSGLRRSRSFHDLNRLSTPCQTPTQFIRRNVVGSQRKFSEGGRTSSIGGPKSARKESRPISEKSFQLDAQQKVQNFFLDRRPDLLDKGSIKPMTAAMFANLVSYLIRTYDKSIVVTRSNLVEEVPNICKSFMYKGKAEKSWLLTVNAPHSWPYVVSFLLWLVELNLASEALNIVDGILYPEGVEDDGEEGDEINFKLLVPHLLKGYKMVDDSSELQQFLTEYKEDLGLDDEEQESLQKEYLDLQTELNDSEDAQEEEKLEELQLVLNSLRNDYKNIKDFVYDSESFVANAAEKRRDKMANAEALEKRVKQLKGEQDELRILVFSQEVTPEQKQEMEDQIATLRREIRHCNEEINDYQGEVYKEDIDLVKARDEFEKSIQSYNKVITVNIAKLPIIKNVQIETTNIKHMDAPNADKRFELVDSNLAEIKTKQKNGNRDLEMEVQKEYSNLQKIEDKVALLNEEKDKLTIQCDQLENEIAEIKQTMAKEKDQIKTLLNEIQQKIKMEKESEHKKIYEDEELVSANQRYNKRKIEIDEYVIKGLAELDKKKESNRQLDSTLQEITTRVMTETKKKIEEILEK